MADLTTDLRKFLDGWISAALSFRTVTFAGLPVGVVGMVAVVSDSNTQVWGATVAGGGAFKVLAFYNGTVWTVAGI